MEYLTGVFTRNLEQILKVFSLGDAQSSTLLDMYIILIELLITIFYENLDRSRVFSFMESRMFLMNQLEELLLKNLSKLL